MEKRTTQISHPSQLNSLIVSRLFRKSGRGTIRLAPEFEHPEKEKWESEINRYYYACGCSNGAKGLLLALIVGAVAGAIAYTFDALPPAQAIALPVIAGAVGVAIGKFAGLAAARRRLTRVVHTIQANWKPHDKSERPIVICG